LRNTWPCRTGTWWSCRKTSASARQQCWSRSLWRFMRWNEAVWSRAIPQQWSEQAWSVLQRQRGRKRSAPKPFLWLDGAKQNVRSQNRSRASHIWRKRRVKRFRRML
jgi:Threonine dehydrogenase and related Zn-dependent dehydrogenases